MLAMFLRLLLCLLLSSVALAQDKEELLRAYRNSWSGYPLEAALFQRFVEVEGDVDWWGYLVSNPTRHSPQFVALAGSLANVANNLGWGDAQIMNSNLGGLADAPPLLQMLDSWKGKLAIRVKLPSGLNQEQKDNYLDNLALLNSPMGNNYVCLPRGGKFFLNVSFNAKATEAGGNVSKDGNSYDLVMPSYARIYTSQIERVFQKGLK